MKQMMFARTFPMTHPKAGKPTWFVEKIWKSIWDTTDFQGMVEYEEAYQKAFPCQYIREENIHSHNAKSHTIRAGNRWKVGDYFAPKVWSGKAYRSKTIQIASPIKVEKVWAILLTNKGSVYIDGRLFEKVDTLAANDGLMGDDFNDWFPAAVHFEGQIICWNDKIEY